jgi:hypothetical protein
LIAFHDPLAFVPAGAEPPRWQDRWLLLGPVIDAPRLGEHFGLYVEGLAQIRGDGRGLGVDAAGTWASGATTLLLEGKGYGDLAEVQPRFPDNQMEFRSVRYATPPTLERLLQPLEHPQREIWGGRARVDRRVSDRLGAWVSWALLRDHVGYSVVLVDGEPPMEVPGTVHDPYAGAEWTSAAGRVRVSVSGGWRMVFADGTGQQVRGDGHADADITFRASRGLTVQLHGAHLERSKLSPPFIDDAWREGTWQLGVEIGRRVVAAVGWDYTSEPRQPRVHYGSVALEWKPSDRLALGLFAGSSRGGLRCVGGVCRNFPPFEGARLAITYRY